MNQVLLIMGRELRAYFRSPLAAFILAGGLLVGGILFYIFGIGDDKKLSSDVLFQFFYNFSAPVMGASLFLSMRLIAEERQTGTATLLQTAPIRESQIIAGKFLSAWLMILLLCLLSAYMPALIFVNGKVSLGHILVGYLGMALFGAVCVAIGLFGSSVANSQVIAVLIAVIIGAPLLLLWLLARVVDPPFNSVLGGLAIHHQNLLGFMQGVLEPRRVVYYVAITFFFLLASTKALEARRWR